MASKFQRGATAESSDELLRGLFESVPDAIVVVDASGRIVRVNAHVHTMFGYRREDIVGKPVEILLPERHRGKHVGYRTGYAAQPRTRSMGAGLELYGRHQDGHEFPLDIMLSPMQTADETLTIAIIRDTSEQKKYVKELRLAAKVLENTSESIVITDAQGIIVDVNPAFTASTGYSREEALGQTTRELLHSDEHDAKTYAGLGKAMHENGQWQGEIWSRRKNSEFYPERLSISTITNEKGETSHYLSISSDISEKKGDEARLRFLANYDTLTSLPNRNLFNLHLNDALAQAQRYKRLLALLFIDLDRFKPVNDALGHDAGDSLLKEVASRLRTHLRQSDTVARFGGDEFLVLIPQYAEISGVVRVTKKILGELERPFMICDKECRISASIGISLHPEDGSDAATLLKKADSAMYRAKEKGKNTFEFFSKISETQAYPASSPQ